MEIAPQIEPKNPDSKTLALIVWVGTAIFGFIPSLVIFLTKKDDDFVQDHAKEALNFCICWMCVSIPLWIIVSILTMIIPFFGLFAYLVFPGIWVVQCIIGIMGAIKANESKTTRLPYIYRFIK